MQKMTPDEEKMLQETLKSTLESAPPTIGVVGVSGVGKSSTINAMFKSSLPISHTVACTKEFEEIPLQLSMNSGPVQGHGVDLVIYDAPGLGEDIRKDPEYIHMYERYLPQCDIILWISSARNRAVALDQQYLKHFSSISDRIIFGISQVDLVEPRDWKDGMPIPSEKQELYIEEIVLDRSKRFSEVIGRSIQCIPYSNYHGFNLEHLFAKMLESCVNNRSWIFQALKGFCLEDYVGTDVINMANTRSKNRQKLASHPHESDDGQSGLGGLVLAVSQFISKGLRGAPPKGIDKTLSQILGKPVSSPNDLTDVELAKVQKWIKEKRTDASII